MRKIRHRDKLYKKFGTRRWNEIAAKRHKEWLEWVNNILKGINEK